MCWVCRKMQPIHLQHAALNTTDTKIMSGNYKLDAGAVNHKESSDRWQ